MGALYCKLYKNIHAFHKSMSRIGGLDYCVVKEGCKSVLLKSKNTSTTDSLK